MKEPARHSRHLVVLSADGMHPDFYRRPDRFGLRIPNLRRFVEEGASADAVESVYPTTTYPAHASLVTGVPPRVHGIYSHLASLDPTDRARPWHWFARLIRVPTLWDLAQTSGYKVAAVSWPVSAGGRIDFNIPEIWDPLAVDPHRDLATAARHSTPGLFDEVSKVVQPLMANATPDQLRAEAAREIWRRHHPGLFLVHFVHYDHVAHRAGPLSPQALSALEGMDAEIGRLRQAIEADGPVTWFLLSDHGFVPVEKEVAPLAVLDAEGLFTRNADGSIGLRRLGAVHAGGSFAVYWLEKPREEDGRALDRAVRRLCDTGAISKVVDRAELESLEADPDAELMFEAADGYYFSDRFEGEVVRDSLKDRGTHGHLPSLAGLEASFIAAGQGIAPGKNLGRISLTQVAPTLSRQLNLRADILATRAQPLDLA